MSIRLHPTEAAAIADLEAMGYAAVPAKILPPSWRRAPTRYFFHHEYGTCGSVYAERGGWIAGTMLSQDSASRTLAKRFAAARNA